MGGKEEEGAWDGYSLRMLVVVVVLAIAGRLSGEEHSNQWSQLQVGHSAPQESL